MAQARSESEIMPIGIPAWATAVGGILALVLPSLLIAWSKIRKERKDDEKILHTAPDDPVGRADFDERERVQCAAKPRSK